MVNPSWKIEFAVECSYPEEILRFNVANAWAWVSASTAVDCATGAQGALLDSVLCISLPVYQQ